ncbi:MAG: sortase [Firmicutes bacterium]|nr:sortase [Bacillota bacterium]
MKIKKILRFCITIIILFVICYVIYILVNDSYDDRNIALKEKNVVINNIVGADSISAQDNIIVTQPAERELKYIKKFKSYDVIAELKIPKIKLDINILEQYSADALNVSATKFYGPNPNEVGNLCISGHNYNSKMFKNLSRLSNGDEISLTDGYNETIKYTVYDIYKVSPDDTRCLSQDTEGRREVTLITCTADSKERIIVKAKEG